MRYRLARVLLLAGVHVVVISLVMSRKVGQFPHRLVGLLVMGAGMVIAAVLMNCCPHCRRWLAHRQRWFGRQCMYCGKRIDRPPARKEV